MQAVNNGEPEQHEREAGHEQCSGNLSGKDDIDGATVIMTHDKRADAQIDVAANNEHADPDWQLSANHQPKYAGEQP